MRVASSVSVFALLAVVAACDKPPEKPASPTPEKPAVAVPAAPAAILTAAQKSMFQPLPATWNSKEAPSPALVALGQQLFHDTRLSSTGEVSCNSCHTLTNFGVDGQPTSTGIKGQKGGRNSPTVLNAAGHFTQFWDGRAKDVEAQAKGPILAPGEMGMKDDKAVVAMIKSIPDYATQFKAVFATAKEPVTFDNYALAVGAFERQLVTPSRFDKWAGGDEAAITDDEKRGALAFMTSGCMACHNGPLLGGSMYQKAGLVKPWPSDKDTGRMEVTKNDADKFMFKVPSLRNIEKTAPYFHDGATASLAEAIQIMGRHQLGKEIAADEAASIIKFLATTTAAPDAKWTAAPALPASGKNTPKPKKA
jgi:cytochrome c peroxidase